MGVAFDYAADRPEHINAILNGLDRYNPECTETLSSYITLQCETQTYDCYANLALLKLYQFNPHLARDETITNILVKALTAFGSPDFSLCLALLQPSTLIPNPQPDSLAEAVQKLATLHSLLTNASYAEFWSTLDGDDLYADLTADISGFEEAMRIRMAVVISQCMQSIDRAVLEGWLNVKGEAFEKLVGEVFGWKIEGSEVQIPLNKENEARSVMVRENVNFAQFGRTVKRAYEQPA